MDGEKVQKIYDGLKTLYPDAECALEFKSPFELLVATILSAQCTDKRVNEVTKVLFVTHNTPADFAFIEPEKLQKAIFSCGFYVNKSKNIINMSRALIENHGGEVPSDFDALLKLPGVGRKTANVVMANAFGGDNIAVDTHVFRVSKRLGLSDGDTPDKVEQDLLKAFKEGTRASAHHLLIFHGRNVCHSRHPECYVCAVNGFCRYFETISKKDGE